MSGVLEAGFVTTFACTAAGTLSASAYANTSALFRQRTQLREEEDGSDRNNNDGALHPDQFIARKEKRQGPLKQDGVRVKLDNSSVGMRGVEFNGEILFVSDSENGPLVPAMALGACNVGMNGCSVTATPASLPPVELTFSNPAEAKSWAKEFKEAVLVGPPQERIQELIIHSMKVEKHVADLRARSERVAELETHTQKLKNFLKIPKAGLAEDADPQAPTASLILSNWLGGGTANQEDHAAEKERLANELQQRHVELERAQSFHTSLKTKIVEHARTNHVVAMRWRNLVNARMQQEKEQSDIASSEATARKELTARTATDESFASPKVANGSGAIPESSCTVFAQQDFLSTDFLQRLKAMESQLSFYRQGAASMPEKENFNYGDNDGMDKASPLSRRSGEEQMPTTQTLEERIRSHQLLVYKDCDVLQQAFKSQLV